MAQDRWSEVDAYFTGRLGADDAALEAALAASDAAGLPKIAVSAAHGKWLNLMAQAIGAKRILEVGTLGGYSAIWLARAAGAGGKVVTLEIDPKHADVARRNLAAAGLQSLADVRVGPAIDSLAHLAEEGGAPFDFVFIDADKPSNADYFSAALRLSRRGTMIVVDNVVREGAVVDASSVDPNVLGVRRLLAAIAAEPRVAATAIQTVGAKGYDGFVLALVVEDPR
jgi:predicted O-methyltransferase YrrM